MNTETDGSTVRGIRLKTGRIVYELRDENGQPVICGDFNRVREQAKLAGIKPKYLSRIEDER